MTTLPIEVIVQDAEAPIVPGEDGTNNTNINTETAATVAVPNTGEGNGSIFSGSASAIVLPAILLVLALGSIVAILIHKYRKQKKDTTSRKEKLAVATSSTIAVLAATVLVGNLILPATKAATGDITDGITPTEDKVSIVVTRDSGSVEESIESTATITSTSDFGYKVLLSMAEGVETSNLYLDGDETSEYYIAPVEVGDEEGAELTDNTWGYALTEDGTYSAVPLLANAATVAEGDEPVENENLSIYYGVKVSSDLPAGIYSGGEIEYTSEAHEPILSIAYMQDFATLSAEEKSSLLSSMPEGYQFTLKDSRDEKPYYVSKLADGNVWMTQNLDLDLKTDGTITYDSTNTNLTVAGSGAYEDGYTLEDGIITWAPANATINFTGDTAEGWERSYTAPYTANPGDVYYYTSGSDENDIQYNSLAECVAASHTAEDCKHYHAGNYYNWSAAVASNDTSSLTTQYDNAANSICPAGWRLPIARSSSPNTGDFYNLLASSGILASSAPWGESYYTENGFNNIRSNPLWLTRSGFVNSDGKLPMSLEVGYYISSTTNDDMKSFGLTFRSSYFYPYDYIQRFEDAPIRCIVRN